MDASTDRRTGLDTSAAQPTLKQAIGAMSDVRLDLQQIPDPAERQFLNAAPTSFRLTPEQVQRLIAAGHRPMRENPEMIRLLGDLGRGAGG